MTKTTCVPNLVLLSQSEQFFALTAALCAFWEIMTQTVVTNHQNTMAAKLCIH